MEVNEMFKRLRKKNPMQNSLPIGMKIKLSYRSKEEKAK